MAHNTNTGIITAPVSMYDVHVILGISDADLGLVCKAKAINMWAKCKPIAANKISPLDYEGSEQIRNYHAGLAVLQTRTEEQFIRAVKDAFTSDDYKDSSGDCVLVKYDRPYGTALAPYRLTDFNGYNHKSYLDYSIHNENASGDSRGDGLPLSPMYSKNIEINIITPYDASLPDDTARLNYYDNWMRDVERTYLHAYDIIAFSQITSISLGGLKRGIMLWNNDYTEVFIETIPWLTRQELQVEFGSPFGKRVNVAEFYYDSRNTVNYKYICIPQFCYTTTCRTRFIFDAYLLYSDYLMEYAEIIISRFEGNLDTFYNLYIGVEVKVPGSETWERIQLSTGTTTGITWNGYITIKYMGQIVALPTYPVSTQENDIRGTYTYDLDGDGEKEGAVRIGGVYESGTLLRVILYGSLTWQPNTWQTFFETSSDNELIVN